LVDILEVLGPIGVPGFGNFSSENDKTLVNCPQVFYALESYADTTKQMTLEKARKGIN